LSLTFCKLHLDSDAILFNICLYISTKTTLFFLFYALVRKGSAKMFEFRIVIGMERGEEQVFIISTDAENEIAAEDQIRYLVNNSLEVLSIEQIKMG